MVFQVWAHERAPLNLQWLEQDWRRIVGLLIFYIWLERAESLITK